MTWIGSVSRALAALVALVGLQSLLVCGGCDTTRLAANSTVGVFERAAPAFEQYWDYELAGDAAPGSIIQLEGVLRVVPDNQELIFNLIRSYCGYAVGWVEDEAEVLEAEGDLEGSIHQHHRARLFYQRALDLGRYSIGMDHEGMNEAVEGGLESFEGWLASEFRHRDDAPILFWTGYAWAGIINNAKDDLGAVADVAFAKAMVERSVALDPDYYNGGGRLMLAAVASQEMGADLDAVGVQWEQLLEQTGRRNLMVQVIMANYYATARLDRELYISLLTEVIEAGDVLPEARLSNRIAKHRAARYLSQVNERF